MDYSGRLSEKKTGDLFSVDTTGDVEGESGYTAMCASEECTKFVHPVAKKLRRAPKPLRSLAILDERSAIPSLTSKPVALAPRKTKISAAEKARLRKIARRDVNIEEGAPISSADLKASSIATKDAWEEEAPKVVPKGGFGEETMVKKTVKAPKTITEQRQNYLNNQVEMAKGLELPSEGTSYNPSAQSHAQLMQSALEEEKLRLAKEEADAARIAVLGEAINARRTRLPGVEYAAGMVVGPGEVDDEDESADDGAEDKVTKQKRRKTQAQRNKALRAKEAARLASLEKTQKRLAKSIGGLSTLEKDMKKRADAMAEAERLAKLVKKEKERMGLVGGEKIGKHRLAKSTVNVQLGEDLAESLRQVKVSITPRSELLLR